MFLSFAFIIAVNAEAGASIWFVVIRGIGLKCPVLGSRWGIGFGGRCFFFSSISNPNIVFVAAEPTASAKSAELSEASVSSPEGLKSRASI